MCEGIAAVCKRRSEHTNMPAIVQFPQARLSIPSSFGRLYMQYSSVMKPGASIVNQPSLPGMLKRESMEVLPIGYHVVNHWIAVTWKM